MRSKTILVGERLTKRYQSGSDVITVLDDVSFSLNEGESCAVVGPSGSGKTTLLTLAAGLDRPTTGTITLCDHLISSMSDDEVAPVRMKHVGFVFQNFQLLPSLTALENVLLPMELQNKDGGSEARELLSHVGLSHRMHHYPSQLSGGEQQRVALARAFITRPSILFADEPTGSLDEENARQALKIMFELNKAFGSALLLVTHDRALAESLGRRIELNHGKVVSDVS